MIRAHLPECQFPGVRPAHIPGAGAPHRIPAVGPADPADPPPHADRHADQQAERLDLLRRAAPCGRLDDVRRLTREVIRAGGHVQVVQATEADGGAGR